MKICSACLLGTKCRYNKTDAFDQKILELSKKEAIIPICPEILAGMSIPRKAAHIVNGTGNDVIDGRAKIVEEGNNDVTKLYLDGAKKGLKIAKMLNIKEAIVFTSKGSPSCGCGKVYVSGKKVEGDGVFTTLLRRNGIKVVSNEDV
jgi:uncharacterized protein YbbK (DUF523 family)